MQERWAIIAGYEGRYEVSDCGRVKRVEIRVRAGRGTGTALRKEMLIKPWVTNRYHQVSLWDGRMYHRHLVHSLVLVSFIGPRPSGYVGCHFDGDSSNNKLANLRWDTKQANEADKRRHGSDLLGERHHQAKLTEKQVLEIRRDQRIGIEIAAEYGISQAHISSIKRRRVWRHLP